ncbi:olfactory receptor 6S1 [Tamandua tetradactyla]|uniref:olfactory receptor 6S1 n=1 Tax=Tamandua tetradactyla TaxID=48850 RepID=UPI004053931C
MAPGGNQSNGVTEFILAGFPNLNSTKAEVFSAFFLVYLLTLTGNVLIVRVVGADTRLQTPMYFFLGNLSCLEISLTSVIIPKMLSNFLLRQHTISFAACITQFYFYFFLGASEFLLLAAMSVDRYLAICHPLHYPSLMRGTVCFRVALACWVGGLLPVLGPTVAVALLPFCGQDVVVQHFFCDSGPLLRLACTNTKKLEETDFVLASLVIVSSLMITAGSYGHIVLAVLRIPSASGRQKAFSTCTSHLMVVTLFYGSAIFLYVRPSQSGSVDKNWAVTVVTTFVTPLLNPFIYALRNHLVKEALKDMFKKMRSLLWNTRALDPALSAPRDWGRASVRRFCPDIAVPTHLRVSVFSVKRPPKEPAQSPTVVWDPSGPGDILTVSESFDRSGQLDHELVASRWRLKGSSSQLDLGVAAFAASLILLMLKGGKRLKEAILLGI